MGEVLLVIKECHVFKIPPRTSAGGYKYVKRVSWELQQAYSVGPAWVGPPGQTEAHDGVVPGLTWR